ncbi:hypothetical protein [Streptomyces sp. NPDC097619]|uniref:hypothetical protein n=1 Tax=Streptomyces sp. NPDC097619 TaxID=3157228 RepID=UPI00331660FF
MQTPAAPDQAHTRARAHHWAATAAALAAVVAAAGLLQPDRAEGTPRAGAAGTPVAPAATAPDPEAVTYPMDCHGLDTAVTARAEGDLDGDGRPETVAAVRCAAGSGTPPSGLYVITGTPGSADRPPRVVATLLDPARQQNVTALTLRSGAVTATLLGYSSPEVPRYAPDRRATLKWHWDGGAFRQESLAAESV